MYTPLAEALRFKLIVPRDRIRAARASRPFDLIARCERRAESRPGSRRLPLQGLSYLLNAIIYTFATFGRAVIETDKVRMPLKKKIQTPCGRSTTW